MRAGLRPIGWSALIAILALVVSAPLTAAEITLDAPRRTAPGCLARTFRGCRIG